MGGNIQVSLPGAMVHSLGVDVVPMVRKSKIYHCYINVALVHYNPHGSIMKGTWRRNQKHEKIGRSSVFLFSFQQLGTEQGNLIEWLMSKWKSGATQHVQEVASVKTNNSGL